jgi:hypothetical protein
MSKKSKLIIGIILLAVGGGLVPTGYFVNNYLIDQVYEGVPTALLKIQDDAVPSLEEQIPVLATPNVLLGVEGEALVQLQQQLPPLATPDVLLGVENETLIQLQQQLPVLATPQVLLGLKDKAIAQLPAVINGSGTAQFINGTLDAVGGIIGLANAIDQYFNSIAFQATYGTPIQGVSELYGMSFAFTTVAENALLYGNGPMPGLITDLSLGLGVLGYMELYLNASLGDLVLQGAMQLYYNATWTQLSALAGYIKDYMWEVIIKPTYSPPYTIEQYAEILFYTQWADGSVIEGGVDLSLFQSGVPPGTYGLEAGIPIPTNITVPTCTDLWDDSNPYSFTNDSGILIWIGAMQGNTTLQGLLIATFSLTPLQLTILLGWLGNFLTNLTPLLIEAETGYTIPVLAQLAFYEQWANGTIQGASVLPEGFLSQLDPSFAGAPYFEVGIPTPSGLSMSLTMDLWDDTNPFSFVNDNGILIWIGAIQGNVTLQGYLTAAFGFTGMELLILLNWLGNFLTIRVPQLLQYETGYTVPELAQMAFYEQWANGTIQGESILPEGFLSQLDPLFAGVPYFEVGIPTASGLSLSKTMALWDESNPFSFVNGDGVLIWVGAAAGNSTLQTALEFAFTLSLTEINSLIAWFGPFLTVRVPQILLYETHTLSIGQLAQFAFYEQWANGTILGESVLPDGLLSERDPPYYGPPYFEIALTVDHSAGLSILQCMSLWNEASNTSLVTVSGINKWYDAKSGNTMYNTLRDANGLTNAQMDDILKWLPLFRDKVVNSLAKDEENLPMKPYELGNTLFIGLGAAGGALAVLGLIFLILSRRSL